MQPGLRLNSWKEIAAHLGVTVRTAQKWERSRGLFVRRFPGSRGPVFAWAGELDEWFESRGPERCAPRLLIVWGA